MAKKTIKYVGALTVAGQLGINVGDLPDQETLYRVLGDHGFFWDSKQKKWEANDEEADPPTDLIRIRVWADTRVVESYAGEIAQFFIESLDYSLIDKSAPYICRPPKQRESRIYLTFLPKT